MHGVHYLLLILSKFSASDPAFGEDLAGTLGRKVMLLRRHINRG